MPIYEALKNMLEVKKQLFSSRWTEERWGAFSDCLTDSSLEVKRGEEEPSAQGCSMQVQIASGNNYIPNYVRIEAAKDS